MYTDETLMPKGKYRLTKLKDVPANYLWTIWVCNGGGTDPHLKEYIKANLDRIREEKDVTILRDTEMVTFICEKRTYATRKAAMESIIKPTSKTQKKAPIRAYECPKCSGWHLTSMPIELFKEIKNNKPLQD